MPGSSPGMTNRNDGRWYVAHNLCEVPSFQLLPARIGLEALAVALRQPVELVANVRRAARAGVVHRPAAEWRKAGREHHRAVDRVLIGDHAFTQAGDADVEHGQDETVRHLF